MSENPAGQPFSLQLPLDDSVLRDYLGDDPALRREVLQQFIETLSTDLQQLESEVRERNVPALQRSAHRLKGACYMVGAKPMGDSAMALEHLAREGNLSGLDAAWTTISAESRRIIQHLAAEDIHSPRR